MGKKIKEFVTYWGPSITDWNDGTEKRFAALRFLRQRYHIRIAS